MYAASATVSHSLRMARMWGWTQPERSSYDSWVVGLNHQERWVDHNFDWSTDFCSNSPDQPLGYDTYSIVVRPVCDGLAATYDEAVVNFGSLAVSQQTLDRFAAMQAEAEARAAGGQ